MEGTPGTVIIKSAGTLEGVFEGTEYRGTWTSRGGAQFCREIPQFDINACQTLVELVNEDGDVVGLEFVNRGNDSGNQYYFKD